MRAGKYGILFLVVTFLTFFLLEVLAGHKLHSLQYLMIGFANCLFFLLLLSLSEHTGFGLAYLLSSTTSIAMISLYSRSVLQNKRHSLTVAAVLSGLYTQLYMTLNSENYALLLGALTLTLMLALTMYFTRKIDWFNLSNKSKSLIAES